MLYYNKEMEFLWAVLLYKRNASSKIYSATVIIKKNFVITEHKMTIALKNEVDNVKLYFSCILFVFSKDMTVVKILRWYPSQILTFY